MMFKILNTYRKYGLKNFMSVAWNEALPRRAESLEQISDSVRSGKGLEIGGPSPAFGSRGPVPIYSSINELDNCNFSSATTWEGEIAGGRTFRYRVDRKPGVQYISEASDLGQIKSDSYDFLLSSHALEHLANPLQALQEWKRVLKDSGTLVLLLPHYKATFDHRRPVTKLQHLIDDYENNVGEDDLSHLEEILEYHDLSADPGAGCLEEFEQRSRNNFENRCLHQHVFDNRLVVQLMTHIRMQIMAFENLKPNHILVMAKIIDSKASLDNDKFAKELPSLGQLIQFK